MFKVRSSKLRGGFTLIEVLVAMSIFAIAVMGLAIGATSVMRANQTSYYMTIATNLAQDKLEELKGMTASTVAACASNCDTPAKVYNNVTFARTWTVTSPCSVGGTPVTGLRCITVTVAWTDYNPRTVTVSSAVKE